MIPALLLAAFVAAPDLRFELQRESLSGTHYRYRQFIDGVPVVGGEVSLTVRPDGRSEERRSVARVPSGPRVKAFPGAVWVNDGGLARLVRRVIEDQRTGPMVRYLDPASGEVVREDRFSYSGKAVRVFEANPVVKLNAPELRDMEDWRAAVPPAAYSDVELPEVRESGPLGGPWVQIADFQGPFIPPVDASVPLLFDREDDRFEDVNAYLHVDRSQRYLQSLGYAGARALVSYAVQTDTHALGGTDNSFFIMSPDSAGRGRLHFGEGGTDDAEDSDLIVHEYAHAIHEWISPATFIGPFNSETRAISEGFGDYWAFSARYAAALASGRDPFCLADWDARCWSNPPGDKCAYPQGADCLRRTDSGKTIADFNRIDASGTEHLNGQIWSAALAEIFLALIRRYGIDEGRRAADTLVLESLFGTPPRPTFATIAGRMVGADRYISSGRNEDVICAAMVHRGILARCGDLPRGEITFYPGQGSGVTVPDNDPAGVTLSAFVGDGRAIESVQVTVNIRHRGRGELRVSLISPDGTVVRLYQPSADRAPDLLTTFGRDTAPVDSLDVFRGRPAVGEWRLRVVDAAFADVATVVSWSLAFRFAGSEPSATRPAGSGQRQVIPVVGRTAGAAATFFRTDLRMFNEAAHETEALLLFTPSGEDGRFEFGAVRVTIGPGQVFAADDLVRTLFNTAGTGQLEVDGDLLVSSRSWTPSVNGGSSGLFAPGTDVANATAAGERTYVVHLRNDASFRSNIGLAEVAGVPARARVEMNGRSTIVHVPPFGHLQVPAFGEDGPLFAIVEVEGEGRVLAYGASIDRRSGDAIYIPAVAAPAAATGYIPAISASGAGGTVWRTETVFTSVSRAPTIVEQTYTTRLSSDTATLNGPVRIDDVVGTFFGRPGTIGTLSATTPAGTIASARIWTAGQEGTLGQFVPFAQPSSVPARHILHLESSAAFRTNIGLFSDVESIVRVTLFDADGGQVRMSQHHLQPRLLEQFAVVDPLINGRAAVEVVSGRVSAYASVIDQRSGDALFVPAR